MTLKKYSTIKDLHPNDITSSGASRLKDYEAKKQCKCCQKYFIINQLKRGREPQYCSPSCRQKEYCKRNNVKNTNDFYGGKKSQLYKLMLENMRLKNENMVLKGKKQRKNAILKIKNDAKLIRENIHLKHENMVLKGKIMILKSYKGLK